MGSPIPKAPKERISAVVDSTCLNVFHDGFCDHVKLELTLTNNREELEVTKQSMKHIETIESPFEANVLHKLAAKKVIGEMVIKMLDNPYEEKSTQDIIDLSVKEQVLSPYTALVGVADEATVVGVSQRIDVGSHDERVWNLDQRYMVQNFVVSSSQCQANPMR